ncbi:MAG: cofactor-independent phosphoglycerate mutase [Armatimonadetes bacterium]|nr:cofactor-independent phosphoglycerate mutase [Armatimonadota bacterium]
MDSSTKYILLVPDGMGDRPLPELDGKTPMQVAKKPNMDRLAASGRVGAVNTIPEGMPPGSDVAAMSLLGYDPHKYYTGRAPIEAASMQIPLDARDVAFRCNLVTSDGETMDDYSAGHVTTEEARELIHYINDKLHTRMISFYPGVSYRHIMVWRDASPEVKTIPPHDILGKGIAEYLPAGDGESTLRGLMFDSHELLKAHPINERRRGEGKNPANMIWLWGQGRALSVPSFFLKTGLTGGVISAVDLLKGLGRATGMAVPDVPGVTGFLDTNFEGKAQYALEVLRDHDFVFIHAEAPDEAGHIGSLDKKIEAIELIDRRLLGPLLEGLREIKRFRIMILPDHVTPIAIRTHASDTVPFMLYSSFEPAETNLPFDERAVEETKLRVEEGFRLIELLLG